LEGKTGHSYEVDIWSLGVIIYTLIIGKPPFETTDVKATYDRIKKNNYSFPDHVAISDPAKDLITRILSKDPSRRPVLDEILNHEFFNNGQSIPKTLP
jgi:polo-like kinase 1